MVYGEKTKRCFHICTFLTKNRADTIYGCQDRKDDVKIGVKSTALLFGDHVMTAVTCFAVSFVALLVFAGVSNHQGLPYYVVSVLGVALHLVWQLSTVDLDSPESCWRKSPSKRYIRSISRDCIYLLRNSEFQAQWPSDGAFGHDGHAF